MVHQGDSPTDSILPGASHPPDSPGKTHTPSTWHLTVAEQRERRRFAIALHDDLAQILVACKIKLSTLAEQNPDAGTKHAIHEVKELLDASLDRARTLVGHLSPAVLHDGGLITAVRWLARHMERYHLSVSVEHEKDFDEPPPHCATLLFSVLRELLFNIVQHARVNHAHIAITRYSEGLHVTVTDHGAGFDVSAAATDPSIEGRYGLFSMRHRIEAAGGTFHVTSTRGKGTVATIRVPIDHGQDQSGMAYTGPELLPIETGQSSPWPIQPLRILLADGHHVVREGMKQVINLQDDMLVIAEASSGHEAVELSLEHQPDVVILDISMPGVDGVEATRRIAQAQPGIFIIGLSVQDDPLLIAKIKQAGAAAYHQKGGPLEDLYQSLRIAHQAVSLKN